MQPTIYIISSYHFSRANLLAGNPIKELNGLMLVLLPIKHNGIELSLSFRHFTTMQFKSIDEIDACIRLHGMACQRSNEQTFAQNDV